MKNFIVITFLSLLFFTSCGTSRKDSNGETLTKSQEKALEIAESRLKDNESIVYFTVEEGVIPIYYSDALDYKIDRIRSEYTDYLTGGIWRSTHVKEMALNSLKRYEKDYAELIKKLESNRSEKKFNLVLAITKKDDGLEVTQEKNIIVIDPETNKIYKWYYVPNTVIQKAVYAITAANDDMVNYMTNKNYNRDSLYNTISDPVTKFIIEPIQE